MAGRLIAASPDIFGAFYFLLQCACAVFVAVDSWGKKKKSCDGSSLVDVGEFLAVLECEMVTSTEGRCVVPAYRTLASVGDATNEAASREVGRH